jgi:predicted nuclease of predicted toxin-antitoxin system
VSGNWRLYLDECIDRRATAALVRQGVDAASTHTLSHNSESDASQLAFAASEERTLLTHDSDFLSESARLLAAGNHHAGILLVADRQDLRWLLRAIRYSLEQWTPDELRDQVRWLLAPPDDWVG